MLFEIDAIVSDLFRDGTPTQEDIQGLSHVAMAAAEGSHRVTGSRNLLKELSRLDFLSRREKGAFLRAAEQVSEYRGLVSKLAVIGRIAVSTHPEPMALLTGSQRVITFPLRWFDITAKIQPVALLGENLSDVGVFIKIGEVGMLLKGYGYFPLVLSRAHGGGSTIGQVLEQLVSENRLCLCIVDSDRSCPNGALGATAQTITHFKN